MAEVIYYPYPTNAFSLLGDKFADLEVNAEVRKDGTKSGISIS